MAGLKAVIKMDIAMEVEPILGLDNPCENHEQWVLCNIWKLAVYMFTDSPTLYHTAFKQLLKGCTTSKTRDNIFGSFDFRSHDAHYT